MALSGEFNQYGYAGYSNLGLYVSWSANQNISGNYSDVTVNVYLRSYNTVHDAVNLKVTAFGVSKTIKAKAVSDSNNTWDNKLLGSTTIQVVHSDVGEKTGTISAVWSCNLSMGSSVVTNMSATSSSITLDKIPRQATIKSAPDFTDEENPTITYSNPLGTKAEALQSCISLDGKTELIAYRDIDMSGTSYTFALTNAERNLLLTAAKTTNKLEVYFIIKTTISKKDYTSVLKKTMTVVNANPSFSSATYKSLNHLDLASSSTVIKGYSNIQVTMGEATPLKQATITSYKVIVGSKVSESTNLVHTVENVDDSIIRCFAIDSRGNVTEKIVNISKFINYNPVTLDVYEANRVGNISSDVMLELSGLAWAGNFGLIDNALSVQYFFKERSSDVYTQGSTSISISISDKYLSETQIVGDLGANGFDFDKNFDIKVIISDKLSTVEKTMILRKGRPGIAVHEEGVAFGNFYDESVGGLLQGYSEKLDKMQDLMSLDRYYPVGSIYLSMNNTNPESLFGGTWEQLKDRFLLASGDTYEAGTTGGEAEHTLTVEEMPSHSHSIKLNVPFGMPYNDKTGASANNGGNVHYGESYSPITIQKAGGGKAHNNMPPYLVVYMWKRIS